MRCATAIIIVLSSNCVHADSCLGLKGSGDGVPAEYYQQKCLGEKSLMKGNYFEAQRHFEKALSVKIFEAPNYFLKLELAEVLCKQGKKAKGKIVLESFKCMANADLGNIQCSERTRSIPQDKCAVLACAGYGSKLSEKGKSELRERLDRAIEVAEICK